MGTPVVSNIIKSHAAVYIAPVGTTLPANTVAYGTAWTAPWARMGFTKEPLAIKYDPDYFDIDVEEFLASVDRVKVGEKLTAETTLAELIPDYLKIVSGNGVVTTTAPGVGIPGSDEVLVGNAAKLDKYIFGFEGVRYDDLGASRVIRFFMYSATFKMNGELEFSKKSTDYSGIPFTAEALADTANSGRLYKFLRVTADPTA
jgi:hypothetical protein